FLFSPHIPPALHSTLFPYTTLFRSEPRHVRLAVRERPCVAHRARDHRRMGGVLDRPARRERLGRARRRGARRALVLRRHEGLVPDRKSTRLNSSHQIISYAVFCLKK